MSERVVLVTGVAGHWGAKTADRLMEEPGVRVIGLDNEPPDPEIKGLDFVKADVRNPLLTDLLQTESVDTVCHLAFLYTTRPSESAFDLNVMGTMKVFGACAQAGVHKIVLRSSTAVYGAHPSNPAFLTPDHPLRGSRRYGYTRDMVEIEAFCNGFRRQMPEMILTILRFPGIVGLEVNTPMNRYLKGAWAPVLLGFDPRMQLIHEEDALGALAHAVIHDASGAFNVAAEGVLPLMKVLSLAGTLPIPILHPLAYWGANLLGGTGLGLTDYVPIELDYIRYPWVADLSGMRAELGFAPTYTAEEALHELAEQKRMKKYLPESTLLARGEEHLRAVIERRRRAKATNEPVPAPSPRQEEEKDNE